MKDLILFDVDGTLSKSRLSIEQPMKEMIDLLKTQDNFDIGIVGGSDLNKQREQLGDYLDKFDYIFSENGLYASYQGKILEVNSIKKELGDENIKKLINCCLRLLSEIDIPVKRGTFIEFRNGMINVCPVGRSCSQEEREEFYNYDLEHSIRPSLVKKLKEELSDLNLGFSIGGQISIDVFPKGWDKTYCLKFVSDKYDKIYFFGDKTHEGGNDYEIFNHKRTIGFTVKNPEDTIIKLKNIISG